MADVLTPEQRKLNMSRIRGKNTRPEMLVRSALHRAGYRFRLHDRRLPGHPDLVLPRFRSVVFVHGCFWHAHGCSWSVAPKTREAFWSHKLAQNQQRDARNVALLLDAGWRVLVIWECALRGRIALPTETIVSTITSWLMSGGSTMELSGIG